MRKFVLALIMALTALGASGQAAAGDGFNFNDMPPLPPPLLDDSAASPSLSPPESGAMSPLLQPSGPGSAPAATPATPPAATPAATTASTPPTPPAPPPLAPPPMAPPLAPSTPTAATTSSVVPPAPPPLAPPPVDSTSTTPSAPPSLALPGTIGGSSAPSTTTASVTASGPETPRQGKVSGGRVNVRAGPNTQYESIAVLTTGEPVTVLAKHGDWYKIVYPADQLASIHKNYVNADIAGEIPEAGLPGVVGQDDADVHAFYWDKSTVVGKLKKGDPVIIKQERGQWYRIAAPETARAYVFAEYVKVDGSGGAVVADAAPPPENPAVDLSVGKPGPSGQRKLSKEDEEALKKKEEYVKQIQDRHAREEEQAAVQVNRLEEALDDLDSRLRAIDQELGSQLSYSYSTTNVGSAAWAPADPVYGGYTGWVENIGRVGGAPASFRLSKGGEIRFYLRSDTFNLTDFIGRRVWVNGRVEMASGAIANVLNVDQIRILTDMEIAESVRQSQEATGQLQAPVAQPYATSASDPYSSYYGSQVSPQPSPGQGGYPAAVPVTPADPSQLPDIVGMGGQSYESGEYYESTYSEVGP